MGRGKNNNRPNLAQIEAFVDGLGEDAPDNATGKAIEAHRQNTSRNPEADAKAAEHFKGQ